MGVTCRGAPRAHVCVDGDISFVSSLSYQTHTTLVHTPGYQRHGHAASTLCSPIRRKKAPTTDTPTQDPGTVWPRRLLYASFQVAGCADPPPRQQRSRSEDSSSVALHRTCRCTTRRSAVLCCVGEVPATPASAMLSIIIDLLQRRSFSKSKYESSAGRSAHTSRDALTAADLFDARRALARHSCQEPQVRGTGRTSGMK